MATELLPNFTSQQAQLNQAAGQVAQGAGAAMQAAGQQIANSSVSDMFTTKNVVFMVLGLVLLIMLLLLVWYFFGKKDDSKKEKKTPDAQETTSPPASDKPSNDTGAGGVRPGSDTRGTAQNSAPTPRQKTPDELKQEAAARRREEARREVAAKDAENKQKADALDRRTTQHEYPPPTPRVQDMVPEDKEMIEELAKKKQQTAQPASSQPSGKTVTFDTPKPAADDPFA